ncbi:hypothetical protein ACLQ2S_13095 [Micromonospora sp. DT48]|uniref:hypothetical protein n=1 Tax=unclassified Micromonospora TaxID=2617518 RepID=UPI0012BD37D9|nr:hypothetical protein [Micromonospora sp. CP22]MTK03974.1 hypothetical protein [Micromonospora sp. CP22]
MAVRHAAPEVFAAAPPLKDQRLPPKPQSVPPLSRIGPPLGRRAVAAWLRGRGALSHLTALDVWGLHRQQAGDLLHVSTPAACEAGPESDSTDAATSPSPRRRCWYDKGCP